MVRSNADWKCWHEVIKSQWALNWSLILFIKIFLFKCHLKSFCYFKAKYLTTGRKFKVQSSKLKTKSSKDYFHFGNTIQARFLADVTTYWTKRKWRNFQEAIRAIFDRNIGLTKTLHENILVWYITFGYEVWILQIRTLFSIWFYSKRQIY